MEVKNSYQAFEVIVQKALEAGKHGFFVLETHDKKVSNRHQRERQRKILPALMHDNVKSGEASSAEMHDNMEITVTL